MANNKVKPKKKRAIVISIIMLIVVGTITVIVVNKYRTASNLEGITYTVRSETY